MALRTVHVVSLALVLTYMTSCGRTSPSRFYTLDSTASPGDGQNANYAVVVGPVSVPPSVDQPSFVVQVAPNQVAIDEFNRWAAPLGDCIARAVAGDLAALLGTPRVATAPLANLDPTYRVTIDVQRFESTPGTSALIDAVWVVRRVADGTTHSGRTVAREEAQKDGFDALAAAHSRALAQVSRAIATTIQEDARARAGTARKRGS